MVVGRTVTAVTAAVVATATLITVCEVTTLSKVDTGRVIVTVEVVSGAVAVALPKDAVPSKGTRVGEVTVETFVGNGSTAGRPSV